MTKKQTQRYIWLSNALAQHGFSSDEVDAMLRCSRVLSTWAEHECNGAIQRDDDTGLPYWYNTDTGERVGRTSNREAGALRRARSICDRHGVTLYHQGDPRGCALYIIRPGDVRPGANVSGCYTNGIAVCID